MKRSPAACLRAERRARHPLGGSADVAGGRGAPRLLVTRPQPQADDWVRRLQAEGLDAVALPLMAIEPSHDEAAVAAAWQALPGCALAMFVSPNAAQRFFLHRTAGAAWPPGVLAGATGPGTAQVLADHGVPPALIAQPPPADGRFDSEALWTVLRPQRDWQGTRCTIVRGEDGREWLAQALCDQGAQVHFVAAYRRTAPVWTAAQHRQAGQALAAPAAHCWLLSSSEALGHLPALCPGADWSAARAVASHPRIAARARALGFGTVQVLPPTVAALAGMLRGTG